MAKLSILVEGWRGINHSYALVNQYQLLKLKGVSGIDLFHKDVPFHFAHWNVKKNYSGLTFEQHQKIVDILGYHYGPDEGYVIERMHPLIFGDE